MSMKYLKGNIFTALHRERHACSTHEIFLKSLEELKDVFHRNSYPIRLIESRINFFLSNDQKPEKEPTDITLVFDYTSFVFFMSRFSSIEKGYRNDQARRNCEAYHIRLKRPKINDQKDLKAFRLF